MLGSDAVWYEDVRVLPKRAAEFFPARDQSASERVNALVRLILYASLAVLLYTRQPGYIAFGLLVVSILSVAYHQRKKRVQRCTKSGTCTWEDDTESRKPARGGVSPDHAQRAPVECTRSSSNNPFANMLLTDDPLKPPACKYDEHKSDIETNFNRGLVRDVFDVYDKNNSQRQFITMPVTNGVPDTVAFANFCYGHAAPPTCKEDSSMCTGVRR